ncbi:anaerobic benzoate catabolism transcriptional regulator [compost metagenome]
MKIAGHLPDKLILEELGRRLMRRRLDEGLTQVQLANQAGLSRSTVDRIESGESAQLASLIRILRTLDMLPNLDSVLPEAGPSPMDLIKLKGKERQRAPKTKTVAKPRGTWTWGDER